MSTVSVAISSRSRYKDTNVYLRSDGLAEFALLEWPAEFQAQAPAASVYHIVTPAEIGWPDKIAAKYYGNGYEDMADLIMFANFIISPEDEMVAGMSLVIPPRPVVTAFQSRVGLGTL